MLARWTNIISTAALIVLISSSLMVGSAREGTENDEYALEISVLDSRTGGPVKAFMAIYQGNDVIAKLETNENGLARAVLPAGNYTYGMEARGYQPVKGRLIIVDSAVALTISMEPVSDDAEKGVLQAHLVDAVKGGPVLGVMTINGKDGTSTAIKSGERGLVKAELPAGNYSYSVEARGYEPVKGRFALKGTVLEIRVSMKPNSDEVPQEPYGVIFGAVMGPEKRPMAGVMVIIMGAPIRHTMDPVLMDEDWSLPPEQVGEQFMERVQTDREGNFKVRVPFGGYQVMVELKGFNPYFDLIEVSKDNREVRVHIMLEKMYEEPPFPDMARAVVDLSYADMDSDGNPEKVHLVIDLDGDKVPELELTMVDRNSDGNPEELNVRSSLPLVMRERIMGLLMMFLQDPSVLPFPEASEDPDDWDWTDGMAQDGSEKVDWDEILARLIGDGEEEEDGRDPGSEEGLDDNKESTSGPVSEREGSNDSGPRFLIAGGSLIALFLLILTVLALGVLLRTKKN